MDMTDAPERIWVDVKAMTASSVAGRAPFFGVGYVRIDKLEELAERARYAEGVAFLAMQRVGKAEAALAEKDKEIAAATAYAETLAVALHSQHYAENTSWRPLSGDLVGLLTQIDNMTSGLARNAGGNDAR